MGARAPSVAQSRRCRPAGDARRARVWSRCSIAPAEATRGGRASSPSSASVPGRSATSRPPTGCARRSSALGWEVRDAAAGFELMPVRVILYGRNPVARGVARSARARGERGVGDRRAPPVNRGWRGDGARAARRGDRATLRLDRAPGHLRAGRGPIRTSARRAARRRGPAGRGARPGAGPTEPGLDLPHRGVRRGGGRGDPGSPRSRGHAGGLQGVGGRRRAPARGARAQHRRLPRRRPAAGCWCYGASAGRGRARRAYDQPDYRGAASCWCSAARARGLRPRVAGACDQLIACRCWGVCSRWA